MEDAYNDRMDVWEDITRFGKTEKPSLGFPSFNEIDMRTVHEAYQYLSMRFVDEYVSAPSTFALLHKSFLKIAKPNVKKQDEPKIEFAKEEDDEDESWTNDENDKKGRNYKNSNYLR